MREEYFVTVADNGYILEERNEDDSYTLVYEGNDVPIDMYRNILGTLIIDMNSGTCNKFKVTIEVEEDDGKPKPKFKPGDTIENVNGNYGVIVYEIITNAEGTDWTYKCIESDGHIFDINRKDEGFWSIQEEI